MVHQRQRRRTQVVKHDEDASEDIALDPDSISQGLPQSATATIWIVCDCTSRRRSDNRPPVFDPTAKRSSPTSNERTSKTIVLGILLVLLAYGYTVSSNWYCWMTSTFLVEIIDSYAFHQSFVSVPLTHAPIGTKTPGLTKTIRNATSSNKKWAYAFLLGGVVRYDGDEDAEAIQQVQFPRYHRGGLYGIVSAVHELKAVHGSQADFVVMVQMKSNTGNQTNRTTKSNLRLSSIEAKVLQKLGIKVVYLPMLRSDEPDLHCFYGLMMEKFRILNWTQYEKVMYLDSDIFPLCNLDYLFELPMGNTNNHTNNKLRDDDDDYLFKATGDQDRPGFTGWRDNLVIAHMTVPASGGIFVLTPNATDYDALMKLIRETEKYNFKNLQPPHWDPIQGWGHAIKMPDVWKQASGSDGGGRNTKWDFYGAHTDQGLLYHYIKYMKGSRSSIILNGIVDQQLTQTGNYTKLPLRKNHRRKRLLKTAGHMDVPSNANTRIDYDLEDIFRNVLLPRHCNAQQKEGADAAAISPYSDFIHFTADEKPWYRNRTHLEDPFNKSYCGIQMLLVEAETHENVGSQGSKKKRNKKKATLSKSKMQAARWDCELLQAQANWYSSVKDALASIDMADIVSFDFIGPASQQKKAMNVPFHNQVTAYFKAKSRHGWNPYDFDDGTIWIN